MKSQFEDQLKKALLKRDEDMPDLPNAGHEERFVLRLSKHQRKGRTIKMWASIAAAACVVGLLAVIWLNKPNQDDLLASNDEVGLTDITSRKTEVLQHLLDESEVTVNSSDQRIAEMLSNLSELDQKSKMLDTLFRQNPHNENIAEAVVRNYEYRLQLMKQLKQYIEFQNRTNTHHHENQIAS